MALTVALWLCNGAALGTLAWRAAPESFPAGKLSCLIAGVGGAFVGGELFAVLGGPATYQPDLGSLLGSTAGCLICLDLAAHAGAVASASSETRSADLWSWLESWSPIVFATAVGGALARAHDSLLLGSAAAAAVVAFLVFWHHYRPRITRYR